MTNTRTFTALHNDALPDENGKHMRLANEIEGYVVVNDAVHEVKVVAIASDDKLVVIFNDGISIQARRLETLYPNKLHAEATLKNRLSDRKLMAEYDAREAERER